MSNPFKNFTVYSLRAKDIEHSLFTEINDSPDHYELQVEVVLAHAQDPSGGQWSRTGFIKAFEDSYIHNLDGAGLLMAVQFNERILPSSVRDEKVKDAVAKLAEQQGHKVNKKDFAQLREQVEFDLLPTCLIRRSVVYALLTPEDKLFVFSSSAKKADMVSFIVRGFFENETNITSIPLQSKKPVLPFLKSVAFDDIDDEQVFHPAKSMLLKGPDKQSIRIKDRDVGSHDVQELLKGDYEVHELGMHYITEEDIDPLLSFKMTNTLVFKGVEIPNTRMESDKDADGKIAFHSFAWMIAKECRALVKAMLEELGGELHAETINPEEDDGEI
jgi:DNA recombination-dependent growth factor C